MCPEDENYDGSLQMMFIKTSHLYFTKVFQQLSDTGVHPGQLPMIHLLHKREGLSQREIAKWLHIKPPTANVSLKRMEKAGLIERRKDEKDQRITRIYLSSYGREFYEQTQGLLRDNEEKIFRGFSESEVCLMKRFLQQVIYNLQTIPGEEPGRCSVYAPEKISRKKEE